MGVGEKMPRFWRAIARAAAPLAACAALSAPLAPRPASAGTTAQTPTADAFVSAANPTGNYGAAGALEVSGAATF